MKKNIVRYLYLPRDLIIVPVAYVLFGAFLFFNQSNLIYITDERPFDACSELVDADVIEHGSVRAYYRYVGPRLVVFYHGNAGNACDRAFLANYLAESGYSYLFPEYPGYGEIEEPSDERIKTAVRELIDLVRAYKHNEVLLVGKSLGAAVAAYHASIAPPEKLVLITPFDSLASVAQRKVPIYPARLLLTEVYETARWTNSASSVLVIASAHDKVVPLVHAQDLYATILVEDKTWALIDTSGHNDLFGDPALYEAMMTYLSDEQ